MMNKKLILQLLAVIAFTGTQINVAAGASTLVVGPIITPAYFAATAAAAAVANANAVAVAAANAAALAAKKAAANASATAATIVNGNVFQTLYIGIVGNPFLFPIAAYVLGAPSPSIQVATPVQYLVYPSNNPNGDALLLTVNSPTSIGVQKCKTINGNIDTSVSLPPMLTYNKGTIYICRNSGMDNGTIFTDATQTAAMTIQMW